MSNFNDVIKVILKKIAKKDVKKHPSAGVKVRG